MDYRLGPNEAFENGKKVKSDKNLEQDDTHREVEGGEFLRVENGLSRFTAKLQLLSKKVKWQQSCR